MNDPDVPELMRWLAAEQAGRAEEADAWFAAVFARRVPRLNPPAALERRVLAAWTGRRSLLDPSGVRWVRAAVALALGVIGLGLACFPPGLAIDGVFAVATLAARALHGMAAAWGAAAGLGLVCWHLTTTIARVAVQVSATGPAAALIGANLLVALLAVVGLVRLLAPREECV